MKRPNILIFNPDQFRADALSHMGNPAAHTPVLDNLVATDAVSFRYAACQNPVCTPSRCSFMSGWYPHVRGHRTMFHMMQEDEPVLLKTLKDQGYTVWWGGKNDLVPGQGSFQPYCTVKNPAPAKGANRDPHIQQAWRGRMGDPLYYSFYAGAEPGDEGGDAMNSDRHNVQSACDFIRGYRQEAPFAIYLPLTSPHPPYYCEQKWIDAIERCNLGERIATPDFASKPAILRGIWERQNLQGLSQQDWLNIRQVYLAMCARIDHQLGMVLGALKEAGSYDDTALFFISDHGDFTGDYGLVEKTQNTFEDCLVRVPFLVKPPKGVPVKPRISEAMIENIDLCATIEELAGITPAHTHFGRSLLPVIAGERDEHRDAVFCEGGRLRGERHCMELESADSQVPTGLYWPRVGLQNQEDPILHGKGVMLRTRRYKYVRRLYEGDELYDMQEDPQELRNRIDDTALAPVLAGLRERMLTFFLETGDVVPHQVDRR